MRKAIKTRKTLETDVEVELNLDGSGVIEVNTGIGFLDHMLYLMAFHGQFDLNVKCVGDLDVDTHHTVEDIAITLGEVLNEALGDKVGIKRYSDFLLPMDESLVQVALDISSRPYLVFNVDFKREFIGDFETENFLEFFRALTNASGITLHINLLYGQNAHHKIEAVFKALGRTLYEATRISNSRISSSKGVL